MAAATFGPGPAAPQEPPPVYQVPDWETPSRSTPRGGALSSLSRLLGRRSKPPLAGTAGGAGAGAVPGAHVGGEDTPTSGDDKTIDGVTPQYTHSDSIKAGETSILPLHSSPTLRSRFDRVLPPNRKYIGLTRKRFLLFVVIPLLLIFLIIIPVAVGVGVSRSRRSSAPLRGSLRKGDLTYYDPGLGACGIESSSSDYIAAVSHSLFDEHMVDGNPNHCTICGLRARVTRGGASVDVIIVDRCVGCAYDDIDLSPAAFADLAHFDEGRVHGSWVIENL